MHVSVCGQFVCIIEISLQCAWKAGLYTHTPSYLCVCCRSSASWCRRLRALSCLRSSFHDLDATFRANSLCFNSFSLYREERRGSVCVCDVWKRFQLPLSVGRTISECELCINQKCCFYILCMLFLHPLP